MPLGHPNLTDMLETTLNLMESTLTIESYVSKRSSSPIKTRWGRRAWFKELAKVVFFQPTPSGSFQTMCTWLVIIARAARSNPTTPQKHCFQTPNTLRTSRGKHHHERPAVWVSELQPSDRTTTLRALCLLTHGMMKEEPSFVHFCRV